MLSGLASFFLITCSLSLLKNKKMPLHFKIKRSTLVCPGECGKAKANLIQDSHIVYKGSGPGYGNENECYPCISKEWKGHISMTGFPFISNLCLIASHDSIHRHLCHLSRQTKTKSHEDCQWESVSAKLRKKPRLLWGTRGLCFAGGQRKDRLCVMNATMKIRAEAVESLVQSHNGLLIQHRSHIPGKINTSGIKTPEKVALSSLS